MAEVKADDLRLIDSPADVRHLYEGSGNDMKAGVEVELCFFDPKSADLTPMNELQNNAIRNAANEILEGNDWFHQEPTADFLEVGTFACAFGCVKPIIKDTNKKIALITRKAQEKGLKRSYFQEFPDKSAKTLLKGLVNVPRYQAFFGPPREDMMDIAAYFSVCKSNQVSISYEDTAHLLPNIRRLYALTPVMFLITDNSSGFDQGKPFSGHAGMHHRTSLHTSEGARGAIPGHLFTAANGDEFIDRHIDQVMNNPLYVYYNTEGELIRIPSGEWSSFNKLREQGLNTASNYYLAQSVLWPDVKIAPLKDDKGEIYNHRYEARGIGVGIHQHQSALLIISGLAFKEDFARETDELLKAFGFDWSEPDALKQRLMASYKAARNHNGKFLDIAYGTGQMHDFTHKFADIIERHMDSHAVHDELIPILDICRTGCTDGKINRCLFPDLQSALDFQRNYDPAIFTNPNKNARMAFIEQLERAGRKSDADNLRRCA